MDEKPFVTLATLATRTGLPLWWLKAEADAGRIPYLTVGKRMMFNATAVERALSAHTPAVERREESRVAYA